MKFLRCLRKAYKTFLVVQEYLPDVIKELKDLRGSTFLFINALRNIWNF